ncbi:triacylglycerol lipase [Streptomyces sp. BSE7-9]|uniref:esterase/lipase family protein n=1 Tax=Streptomyces sp. BSE7-9 TaxID=2759948 RepID=UPI0018EE9D1D|nr:alpha/beta hydrolase [Streptomyces sp. BSE7-9]MBJ6645150.1 alpha/beta hydrolase [Streptomyces sp. BSE7-9]
MPADRILQGASQLINHLPQTTFREQGFDAAAVNLHTRIKETSRQVILFVHGLGGGGYTTWRDMPRMMFEGTHGPHTDVAIFDYRSGLRAWKRGGANLTAQVSRLKMTLQSLTDDYGYSEIYIAAHSLGGIITEAAIQKLFHGLNKESVTSLAAVILFASPRAGSGWATLPAFREAWWLKRFSKQVTEGEEYYSTHIEGRASPAADLSRFFLPHYACIASDDRFVSKFSAQLGVPGDQCLALEGTHKSVVKPDRADHPQVRWLHKVIRDTDSLRTYARTRLAQASRKDPAVIVSELRPGVHGMDWEDIYHSVRKQLSNEFISVEDRQSHPGSPVDIVITVRSTEIIVQSNSPARDPILNVYAEYVSRKGELFVGICAVGEFWQKASELIAEWLPGNPERGFYIHGVLDDSGVYEVIIKCIQAVIQRNSRMQGGSRINRILDLPPDPYEIPEGKPL